MQIKLVIPNDTGLVWDKHNTEQDKRNTVGQTQHIVGQTQHRAGQTQHEAGQTQSRTNTTQSRTNNTKLDKHLPYSHTSWQLGKLHASVWARAKPDTLFHFFVFSDVGLQGQGALVRGPRGLIF